MFFLVKENWLDFVWLFFRWKFLCKPGEVSVFVGQVGDCEGQVRRGEERTKNMLTTWMSIGGNCTVRQERKTSLNRQRWAEKEGEKKESMWLAKIERIPACSWSVSVVWLVDFKGCDEEVDCCADEKQDCSQVVHSVQLFAHHSSSIKLWTRPGKPTSATHKHTLDECLLKHQQSTLFWDWSQLVMTNRFTVTHKSTFT